jgi:small GTP-binding protein
MSAKVVFVGDTSVGKTRILSSKSGQEYSGSATIGADFLSIRVTDHGDEMLLHCLDTAGQEEYQAAAGFHMDRAMCCVVVYDRTAQSSFDSVARWVDACRSHNVANIIVVGNKCDLEPVVDYAVAQAWCDGNGVRIAAAETSAVTGEGINELFHEIVDVLRAKPPAAEEPVEQNALAVRPTDKKKKRTPCNVC